MKRRLNPRNLRQIIAASLAMTASLVLLLVPVYTQVELTGSGPGRISQSTLLETVGPSLFVPLLIPVALTALPLLMRERARTQASVATTAGLAVFVVIGSASIGWFYVPALAAAIAAVAASKSSRGRLQARPS